MGIELEYSEGQTPLDEDEKEGLWISTITTQKELDDYEQLKALTQEDVRRCMEMGREFSNYSKKYWSRMDSD